MLAAYWDQVRQEWEGHADDPRPPVCILVCENTKVANTLFGWIAEYHPPTEIPPCGIEAFQNIASRINAIRVDSKVVYETDLAEANSDEFLWMRHILDSVGKVKWPEDGQGWAWFGQESRRGGIQDRGGGDSAAQRRLTFPS